MRLVSILRSSIAYLGIIKTPDLVAELVADHPDREQLQQGRLYLVGDRRFQKWAVMACPCGCGESIMLSLSQKKRPSWSVAWDWLGRPSVDPSVRQTAGCYAHFWVRRGRVEWCGDTGRPWRMGQNV